MNEKNGQSDTTEQDVTNENAEFNDIAKALNDGDYASLDRLMAAEDKNPKPDTAVDTDKSLDESDKKDDEGDKEDEQNLTDDTDKKVEDEKDGDKTDTDTGKPDKETDVQNTEAAKSAASTAKEVPQDLEQELHRLRSDAGRVPYMQRRLAELEREVRAYKARTPNASTDGAQPKAVDLDSITLDADTKKQIEDLKETDPVMARVLERIAKNAIATAMSRDDHLIDTFTKADEEADNERFFLEQKAELTRLVPQHEAVFATPEWRQWKDTLTPGFRAMAESGLASEVSQAIYAFAADMQRTKQTNAATGQPDKVIPSTDKTSEVSEERARKVASSSDAKNPAAKKTQELDEDAYFSEVYNKLGKINNILP